MMSDPNAKNKLPIPEGELSTPPNKKKVSTSKDIIVTKMTTVQSQDIEWLWSPYIPLGKVTLIEGDPEAGKTWLALNIAAAGSNGKGLPDKNGVIGTCEPFITLYVTCEDGLGDTLKPRLEICGADCDYIYAFEGYKDGTPFTFEQMEGLEAAIAATGAKFVVIDPLQGFLGSIDMHRANEVRPLMTKLYKVAEKHNVAIACIRHCRKMTGDKALHKGLGSIDFTAQARSVIFVGTDPNEPTQHVMMHSKCSIGPKGHALSYEITIKGEWIWMGVSEMTLSDLEAKPDTERKATKTMNAETFLRDLLIDAKGGLPVKSIKVAAEAAKLGWSTLEIASNNIGVHKSKSGFGAAGMSVWKIREL